MRMRVSVVYAGVVLTMASVIELGAQGKGKPGPQPVLVTATIQSGVSVTVDNDGAGSYSAGADVLSQIYASSGDWVLDLTAQTTRIVRLTFVATPGSPAGPTGNYNARLLSRCFDGNDNISGVDAIAEGASNDRCSLRVGFTVGRQQYVLVMSPLQSGTGWVTVSCSELPGADGDSDCDHWTITPGTGANATIANLYEIGKAGREILKGSYENTFAIDVTR
jgi:hypothetical protein